MGGLLPKTPTIQAPPPAPEPPPVDDKSSADIQAAKAAERERLRQRAGRSSTILTGSQGLAGPAATQRKTLLGQ